MTDFEPTPASNHSQGESPAEPAPAVGDVPPSQQGERIGLVQRLFVQHAMPLRGFIVALLPDLARVDDVFQETFLTITDKADVFDPSRDFLPWACGIARNKIRELARKSVREWQPLSEEVMEALAACQPATDDDDRRLKLLGDCISSLSPHSKQIVELCYHKSHKPAEVARVMSWSVEAVYVALSRARSALRACVEHKMLSEGGAA